LFDEMSAIHPPNRDPLGRNPVHVGVSSQAVDVAIAMIAARQNGNITCRQLLDLGLDDKAIAWRLKKGRLYRVFRGVYSVGRRPVTPQERASAAVLACGPGAALSHSSAMTLWGYWRHWDQPFEVTVVGDRRSKEIRVHRSTTLRRHEITTQLGIRVTTPARTLIDMAPSRTDRALKRMVNNALNSLWLTEDQLAETLAHHQNLPGAKRLAKLIGLPGTPTRSGWEDDFPAFCAEHGLPAPVMGVPMGGYILDALFPNEKVIVELDSWRFHRGKVAFETDRERDATTLAKGFVTVRVTEERLDERPRQEALRLHAILVSRRRAHAPSAA
jgi:Transcriptional regulator, AbiEi antitoxin/Protein of unknown function (DUF559)